MPMTDSPPVYRRILLKLLAGIVCLGLASVSYEYIVEGPAWFLEGRDADLKTTWQDFQKDCGRSDNASIVISNFESKYKNKVVEWEGHVMRVDADIG